VEILETRFFAWAERTHKRVSARYQPALTLSGGLSFLQGWALRQTLRDGYTKRDFLGDLLAGITVGIIALPLAMALAIASGVPPQHGLYTAVVAGAIIAVLGGSRISVSGPTAAFVVILAPISAKYGVGGLMLASLLAGFCLIGMGMARFGKLIQFIPYPVTTGFTAGIAVVIGTLQVKDFLGLSVDKMPEHYVEKVGTLIHAMGSLRWPDAAVGVFSLALLIVWPKLTRKVPGALVASVLGAVVAYVLSHYIDGFSVKTIGTQFSYGAQKLPGIPPYPPMFMLPWNAPGGNGEPVGLSFTLIKDLAPQGLAIAMLGAIESLLCAVVADGMAGTKHDPDCELIAQGVGNVVAPFFGGFAATGAIARTAANIRAGGKTPFAALVHAIFVLLAMLLMAPILAYLPMATLAALLLMVAWNMSDLKHFVHIIKVAPKSDVLVLLACFSLTVIFDMVVAVSVGIVLAALLFMRRMASITHTRVLEEEHTLASVSMPAGVFVYEIAGPLFFGAAERAIGEMGDFNVNERPHAIIIQMHGVPVMDVTGLVALESVIQKARRSKTLLILSGVQDQPMELMAKSGVKSESGRLAFCFDLEQAAMLASVHEPRRTTTLVKLPPV
jgi:SulP family sulfate permease